MNIPDYTAALRMKASSVRLGVPREFFFAGLDPEIEAAVNAALPVLEKLTTGLRQVSLQASTQERLRAAVRAAEAYAYHAEFVAKTPELYQPETLTRIRIGADIATLAYIQGRRELALTRRTIGQVFETVDVLVTPTTAIQPPALSELMDVSRSMEASTRTIRNTSPFNVYGFPTISIPCGFTRSGLPIGLQISGPLGGDALVLRLAYAYEQATDWQSRRPRDVPMGLREGHAEAACSVARTRRTRTFTSTRDPSLLMIDMSRSTVNRPRSALRMREKSAAAIPVRPCAARTLRPSRSRALMISAARIALNCWASPSVYPRSWKTFPPPCTTSNVSRFIATSP